MRILLVALFLLMTSLVLPWETQAGEVGSRPRNVAVSPNGLTVLITSMGSTSITQFHDGVRSHLEVEAPTWGVCFLDDGRAALTHVGKDGLTLLQRSDPAAAFTVADRSLIVIPGTSLDYGTDVIPSPFADHVLVATRGRTASSQAGSWQHAVHEINVNAGTLAQSIQVEREPRALAVYQNAQGTTLFVAHVQGTLGTSISSHAIANTAKDGGSVLAIDLGTGMVRHRFAVGSPVRDVTVWDDAASGFRIFYTHVGEGAQGENPAQGGLVIPNVITTIAFGDDHEVEEGSRKDVLLTHITDYQGGPAPPVIPERLTIGAAPGGGSYLWITHSASGTIQRIALEPNGSIPLAGGAGSFVAMADGFDTSYQVMIRRTARRVPFMEPASTTNIHDEFFIALPAAVTAWSTDPATTSLEHSSNPRGIAYDTANDRVLAVTHFDQDLVEIDAAGTRVLLPLNLGLDGVGLEERRFFTFGSGFDFREDPNLTLPASPVDNLSCGTCHVDGHHDGKVRITQSNSATTPVVVPSVFDVGNTEWLFFDGLTTVVDDDDACGYCVNNRFFPDTKAFTDAVRSPHSPHAQDQAGSDDDLMTASQRAGRGWFDKLNCSRCHQGEIPLFVRTPDPALDGTELAPLTSPNVANAAFGDRLLNDRTQVIVNNSSDGFLGDGASVRNRTDVGTRIQGIDEGRGVNTPSLAGAWDNRPYMHDGRYASIEAVLNHTWLAELGDCGYDDWYAAPDWECMGKTGAPDNFSNDEIRNNTGGTIHAFSTHAHLRPSVRGGGSRINISEYFDGVRAPAQGYDEFVDFLLSLSSHTDPCSDASSLSIGNTQAVMNLTAGTTTVSWTTDLEVSCRITWGVAGGVTVTEVTPVGSSHQVVLDTDCNPYEATIEAELALCGVTATPVVIPWAPPAGGFDFTLDKGCTSADLNWTTCFETSCLVEYGPKRRDGVFENTTTTPAGTIHHLQVPVSPGDRYMVRVTPQIPVGPSVTWYYAALICNPFFSQASLPTGLNVRITPNPFNPRTEVLFSLATPQRVQVRVYDTRGRLVSVLADGTYPAGEHRLPWAGTDSDGRGVASGTYFVELRSEEERVVRRIALLK